MGRSTTIAALACAVAVSAREVRSEDCKGNKDPRGCRGEGLADVKNTREPRVVIDATLPLVDVWIGGQHHERWVTRLELPVSSLRRRVSDVIDPWRRH